MCGIIGFIKTQNDIQSLPLSKKNFRFLIQHTEKRGRDSSGYVSIEENKIKVVKKDYSLSKILKYNNVLKSNLFFAHSRLITNGLSDNQPVILNDYILIHNGIIVNDDEVFTSNRINRNLKIDSEAIIAIFSQSRENGLSIDDSVSKVFEKCRGTISAVIYSKKDNKLILFSNNGSLYFGKLNNYIFFSSEKYPLTIINCLDISQIFKPLVLDLNITSNTFEIEINESNSRILDLIPSLGIFDGREKFLEYKQPNLKRCKKCILPETMPFIEFDESGVCNYCKNYKLRNNPKPISELQNLLEKYKKKSGNDCIIPFSGGRDSCFGLHLAVKKLGMKPITYTYDWGMVTDLARRNISRMCAKLGVENIIVADNIQWKRENVRKNVVAWLKNPDLGMVNIFTAGDKHFFRHVEDVKIQTGINLDLWSVNPLEVTHFKSGFLGVKPDFLGDKVYSNGLKSQLNYQSLRLRAMIKSPSYFNRSIFDTLQGEYYRSFHKKNDYYHLFDYYTWDENEINDIIINEYEFEMSPDTSTTWRIGDGTAAFYNYIYYTIAGFSEHDTFRSNQIREGQITREKALELVKNENLPRYQNIAWYLEAIGLDFEKVIKKINSTKKLY
jgi:glucosamine--fructose-6-phosphate aminotransferase (isomerizing)